jgi:TonB-dependent receptor
MCLLVAGQAFAGGKITGTVTDGASGETLIGVSVSLKQPEKADALSGTITDIDGNFSFEAAAGTYELEIKYVGYQAKTVTEVVVAEGKVTTVPVTMSERKNTELDEVVIRGTMKKESVNALYTMQKNAVSVSSGISADLIKRSPDRNTGEVLKRVSGASVQDNKFVVVRGLSDRYNTAMINNTLMPTTEPNRKAFSFDIIPSNLIDNLVINKTATPELPGDFAGGVIQVYTKDIPDENFINLNISLGYNTQSTFKDFLSNGHGAANNFGFDSKDRKLTNAFGDNYTYYKKLSQAQQIEASKTLKNNYGETKSTALPSQSYQVSWGNTRNFKNGGKFGSIIAINYRRAENINQTERRRLISDYTWTYDYPKEDRYMYSVNTGIMANFAYVVGKSKFGFKNLYNRLYDDVYYKRNGYNVSNAQQQDLSSSVPMERGMLNSQLEGEHAFGANNSKIYWNLNFSNLDANQNDLRTAFYSRPMNINATGGPEERPELPYEIVDRNSRRFFSDMNDKNYGANASYTTYFNLFNQKQTFKAGYYLLSRNRDFQSRIFNYQASNIPTFNGELAKLPAGQIFSPANMGTNGFVLNEFTNPTDAYKVSGLLNAGFLMLDNKLTEKVRLIWGARLESYSQKMDISNQSAIKQTLKQSYVDVLPSVNLSYSLNDKSNLRVAASQTVSRPEFWEIAPFSFFDFDNNWVIEGNPELKRGKITNLDLRYELYPKAGETITFSVFYKHFNDPIETYLQPISGDADYISYTNSKAARSIGAELEVRKSLGFINSSSTFLENVILSGNVAYINSKVDLGGFAGAKDRPMMGQSPYLVNLSAQYADPKLGLTTTVLFNRIGQRIAYVGNATRPNIYENGRSMLDFQLSKSILKKNGELKFTVSDILNRPYVFYQDMNGDNKAYQANDGTLSAKSGDSVFRKYQMGTTFTLSFTYNFRLN